MMKNFVGNSLRAIEKHMQFHSTTEEKENFRWEQIR